MLCEEFGLDDVINLHGKEEELVWMGKKAIHFWVKGQQSKGPRMHAFVFYQLNYQSSNNCKVLILVNIFLRVITEAKQMGVEFWKD